MKKANVQTILMLTIIILICLADNLHCQPFLGPGISNKGMNVQIGALFDKTEISASYCVPFTKNTNPKIAAITIGQKIEITKKDEDNFSVMPYVGYGYLRWQDFKNYDSDPSGKTPIDNLSSFNPVIGLQVGKDSHAGNVYLYGQYVKRFYVGIGLKCYLSKL